MQRLLPLTLCGLLGVTACTDADETTTAQPNDLFCGIGTKEVGGKCVPVVACGAGTVEVDGKCVPEEEQPLVPGNYASPLVPLQRLQGEEDHMHIAQVRYRESDARLFFCSYTFGVIDASDPQDMSYLAEGLRHQTPSGSPRVPGCLHLAWDEDNPDIIYTTHRGNIDFARFLSGWNLQTDPADDESLSPVQLPALQEVDTAYGGLDVENSLIYVALQETGLGIYDYSEQGQGGFVRLGTVTGFDNAWNVVVRGTTAYVADGPGGLAIADVTDPAAGAVLGRASFEGNAEDLVIDGDFAYVAAGSGGLVVVNISDAANPSVVATMATPGSAVGVAYAAGRVYVAAWNDVRVYDVADPTAPSIIGVLRLTIDLDYEWCTEPDVCVPDGDRPPATARTLHVAAHENFMFVGNWWVPYSYAVYPERVAPSILLPEEASLMDFGPVEVGKSASRGLKITNQGTAPLTLYDNTTDNAAFTVEPRQVRIEPGESSALTVKYTAAATTPERAFLDILSDDPLQPLRTAFLTGNLAGLSVGDPLPETTATLFDGSTWTSSMVTGQVTLLAYFATF